MPSQPKPVDGPPKVVINDDGATGVLVYTVGNGSRTVTVTCTIKQS